MFGIARRLASVLDRLVRRAVLAEADRIVRGDEDHALLHQRRQPERRAAIVGEHQEGAAVGDDAAMHRHAVHGCDHGVLAHAVADVAAAIVAGSHRLGRRRCWSGWNGSGRPSRRPWSRHRLGQHAPAPLARLAAGPGRLLGRQLALVGVDRVAEARPATRRPCALSNICRTSSGAAAWRSRQAA